MADERLTSNTLKESFKHCVDAWGKETLIKEFWKIFDKLAAYEDKAEQGLLVELPCEVGTIVYYIDVSIELNDRGKWITRRRIKAVEFDYSVLDWIDTPIFLTPEAAKKALKEREGK